MQKKKSHHILFGIAAMIGIGGIVASVLMIKNQPLQTNYNYIKKEVEVINPVYKKKEEVIEKEVVRKNLIKDKQYYYDQLKDIVENKIKIDVITQLFLKVDFENDTITDLEDAIDIFNNKFFVIDVPKDSIENVVLKNDTNYFQLFSIYEDFKVKEEFIVNQINLNEYFDNMINATFITLKNLNNPTTIQQTWIRLLSGRYKERLKIDIKNTAIFKKSHQRYKEILQWNDATINQKINDYVNQNFNQPNHNIEYWYRFLMDLQPTNPPIENQPSDTNNTDPNPNDTSTNQPENHQDQPTSIENDPPQPPISNEIVLERNEINTSLDEEINKTIINTPNTNLKQKFIEFKNQLQNEPNNDKHKKLLQDIKTFNDTLNEVYTKLNQLKENAQIKKVLDRFNENNNIITLIDGINDNNDIINEVNQLKTDYDTLINVGVEIKEEIIPNLNDAPELVTNIIENTEVNNTTLFRNKKDEINPYWLKINKILPKTQELYSMLDDFMSDTTNNHYKYKYGNSNLLGYLTNNTLIDVEDFNNHKEEYKNNTSEIVEKTKQYYEKLKVSYEPSMNNISETIDLNNFNNLYLNQNSFVDLFIQKFNKIKNDLTPEQKTHFQTHIINSISFNLSSIVDLKINNNTFLSTKPVSNDNIFKTIKMLFTLDMYKSKKFKTYNHRFEPLTDIGDIFNSYPYNYRNSQKYGSKKLWDQFTYNKFFNVNKNKLLIYQLSDDIKEKLEYWDTFLTNNLSSQNPVEFNSNIDDKLNEFNDWFDANYQTISSVYNSEIKDRNHTSMLFKIFKNITIANENNNLWNTEFNNLINKLLYDLTIFFNSFFELTTITPTQIDNILEQTKNNIINIINFINTTDNLITSENKEKFLTFFSLNNKKWDLQQISNDNETFKSKIDEIWNKVNNNADNLNLLTKTDIVNLVFFNLIYNYHPYNSYSEYKNDFISFEDKLTPRYFFNHKYNFLNEYMFANTKIPQDIRLQDFVINTFREFNLELNESHLDYLDQVHTMMIFDDFRVSNFTSKFDVNHLLNNNLWLGVYFDRNYNDEIYFKEILKQNIVSQTTQLFTNRYNMTDENLSAIPRFKELWDKKDNLTYEELKEFRKLSFVIELKHRNPEIFNNQQ